MIRILTILLALVAAGCASSRTPQTRTPEQVARLQAIRDVSTTWTAPRDSLAIYRDRARGFFARNELGSIRYDEEARIENTDPTWDDGFVYRVRWSLTTDSVEMRVQVLAWCSEDRDDPFCARYEQAAADNAGQFARYIRSEVNLEPDLFWRFFRRDRSFTVAEWRAHMTGRP